jgi:hypothetical protein
MGFAVSLSCWIALLGSHEAHKTLVRLWNSKNIAPSDIAPISARADCDATGAFKKCWFDNVWFLCPWHCIPIIFMIVWSVVGYTITRLPSNVKGADRGTQVEQQPQPSERATAQNESGGEQDGGGQPATRPESK